MDITDSAVVVALTELVKNLVGEKVGGYVTIIVAALIGAALGYARGVDVVQGAINGLVAAGIITVGKNIASKK